MVSHSKPSWAATADTLYLVAGSGSCILPPRQVPLVGEAGGEGSLYVPRIPLAFMPPLPQSLEKHLAQGTMQVSQAHNDSSCVMRVFFWLFVFFNFKIFNSYMRSQT